jgi:anti-sigma factor RsiW
MTCKETIARIPALLRGELTPAEQAAFEEHLAGCPECTREYEQAASVWKELDRIPDEEPRPELRARFDAMVAGYREAGLPASQTMPKNGTTGGISVIFLHPFIPRLAAAVVLIAAGFMAGRMSGGKTEIATLHDEVNQLRDMVAVSLTNQESTIQRLDGLAKAVQVQNPDREFYAMLVNMLNTDPDVNVRLATVDAITRFTSDDWVRRELVRSLAVQTSPLVQVSLIDLLVGIREERAVDVLRAISNNEQSLDAVRKRARRGIQQII